MYASDVYQGRQRARVPPPPPRAERRLGYPRANFFYFSKQIFYFFSTHPHNIINLPIFFPSERFSLPLRVFPYPCIFSCLWGQKRLFLSYLCLCGYYTHYSRSLLFSLLCFSVVFFSCISLLFLSLCYVLVLYLVVTAVFFADLPILLPSVGLSLLLCVIIRLGVFRGSEAKNLCFVLWLGSIYTEKGRTRHLCAPSALCLWLVISCAGMMSCCCVG